MDDREKLIRDNMGYVVTLARQYKSELLSIEDLVSEGSIGLIKAAERFDPQRGKAFVTFAAPYIRRSIEHAISRVEPDVEVRSTDESLPVGSRNNYTLLNVLEDVNAQQADVLIEHATLAANLRQHMGVLNERERMVVSRYYGIDTERETMCEIGSAMGLKRERVRQIRKKALYKLQRAARLAGMGE